MLLAGMQFRIILISIPLLGGAAWAAWHFIHDYQRQRILTFLNPENDPLGAGYHIIQSQIAIGSGGVFGKGYMNGSQAQLEFLPERSTDFIFAVIGEEFGLLGQLLILALYGVVIGRALYLAMQGQDTFARLTGGRHRAELLRLRVRQFRHGERHPAGGRRAPAADQLRRHLDGDAAGGLRNLDVAAFSPQAHRILGARMVRRARNYAAPRRGARRRVRQPRGRARHASRRRQELHRAHGESVLLQEARSCASSWRARRASPPSSRPWTVPPKRPKLWYEYRADIPERAAHPRGHGILARASPGTRSSEHPLGRRAGIPRGHPRRRNLLRPPHRAITGCSTRSRRLAFDYPPRDKFFRDELEQFLLLTRDIKLDPLVVKGSYAGAMGAPQFMPSNYRRYAVDADADGRIDLWSNWSDVCASVGNYLKEHGWNAGEPVLSEATVDADKAPISTAASSPWKRPSAR